MTELQRLDGLFRLLNIVTIYESECKGAIEPTIQAIASILNITIPPVKES
jgi:hypothetical protein